MPQKQFFPYLIDNVPKHSFIVGLASAGRLSKSIDAQAKLCP